MNRRAVSISRKGGVSVGEFQTRVVRVCFPVAASKSRRVTLIHGNSGDREPCGAASLDILDASPPFAEILFELGD
jgi:hypothetical protein